LRWRAPVPVEPWDGIRDASTFGAIAPQAPPTPGVTSPSDPDASEPQSEDCLFLNVWTPALDPDARRPVLFFIHGGGFTSGSGSVFLYRGGNLVRNGDAVVVTINYRLGALGFLGHRQLGDADGLVGNWGLMDQVAALTWVRENIAAFGGDPGNVTIFGESAGGFSVAALLGCPVARGLFRRAIVQSGGAHVHTVEEAERAASRLAAELGVASCDRASLEGVPATELVAATTELGKRRPDPGLIPLPFLPVTDGVFLPTHPLAAVAAGASADVDLLIGTNRDELTLFGLGNPALFAMDEAGLERWMANAVPEIPPLEMIEAYREARRARSEGVEVNDVWVAAGTDIVFRWPSLQLAAAHGTSGAATFVYLFDWESPAFDGMLGSTHALELPFVFGAVHVPVVQFFSGGGPAADTLSRQMQMAWLAFARRGEPSHEGIGEWRQWEGAERATMVFGAHTGLSDAPRDRELTVLERYRPLPAPAAP
jgi:para-nitrobenzyl esterase